MINITKNSVTDSDTTAYESVADEAKTAQFAEVSGHDNTYAFYAPELTLQAMEIDANYNFTARIITGKAELNGELVEAGDVVEITGHPSFFVRTRMDETIGIVVTKTLVTE